MSNCPPMLLYKMQDHVFPLKFGAQISGVTLNSHTKCQTGSLWTRQPNHHVWTK